MPHIHPRAAEEIYVVSGQNVSMGFIEENGGEVRQNFLNQGQATFFPQGSIHFQFNDNCQPATLLASLNNEDPGALAITTNFFKLPDGVIEASLGLGDNDKRVLAGQINMGSQLALADACKARCK